MGTFSDTTVFLLIAVVKIAVVLGVLLTGVAYATWLERKVVAHIQARWGPYLVGPHGLLQPAGRRREVHSQRRYYAPGSR